MQRDYKIEILDFQTNVTGTDFFKTPIYSTFNKTQFSVEFTLKKKISEWSAVIALDTLTDGKPRCNELKLGTNVCGCLKSGCRNNFVAMLFKELFRSSNFPKGCPLVSVGYNICVLIGVFLVCDFVFPLSKDNLYHVRNYTIRTNDFPPFIPIIDWQISVEMKFNRMLAMIWYMKGRTVR